MKTIIAGSRTITDKAVFVDAMLSSLDAGIEITEVLSGCAKGVDSLGEKWAQINGFPLHKYPANWEKYGRRAGFLRNMEMAANADALIAIWDGQSKGTKHMIDLAEKAGLKVYVHRTDSSTSG